MKNTQSFTGKRSSQEILCQIEEQQETRIHLVSLSLQNTREETTSEMKEEACK